MAIVTIDFTSLDGSLSLPNVSLVDVTAVVAYVGALNHGTIFPHGIRKLTLKDKGDDVNRAEGDDVNRDLLIEVGGENYFLNTTKLVVDSNARKLKWFDNDCPDLDNFCGL
ncbi:hypothetical protein ACP70R_006609 [Stipagrostis hirtigluma subsp. patula]